MGPGLRRDRGHVAKRIPSGSTRKFLRLKRWSGCRRRRRRVGTLWEALLAAARGGAATPEDVVSAAQAALAAAEAKLARGRVKEEVRSEVAAEANWLWWGELGRKLAPKLLAREGDGRGVVDCGGGQGV